MSNVTIARLLITVFCLAVHGSSVQADDKWLPAVDLVKSASMHYQKDYGSIGLAMEDTAGATWWVIFKHRGRKSERGFDVVCRPPWLPDSPTSLSIQHRSAEEASLRILLLELGLKLTDLSTAPLYGWAICAVNDREILRPRQVFAPPAEVSSQEKKPMMK
jgi:hypothetical protein